MTRHGQKAHDTAALLNLSFWMKEGAEKSLLKFYYEKKKKKTTTLCR